MKEITNNSFENIQNKLIMVSILIMGKINLFMIQANNFYKCLISDIIRKLEY